MTTLVNALLRAKGAPENNRLPDDNLTKKVLDAKDELIEEGCVDITNEFGFKEFGTYYEGRWMPLCSGCGCHTMTNRGQGTICDSCNYEAISHMVHD